MVDTSSFILISISPMILLGLRHALDVDHISAIDNLVRLHNATRKSRWVGGGFSIGHMISVLAEMILIIYVIGNIKNRSALVLGWRNRSHCLGNNWDNKCILNEVMG
jgi:nickel/cobalt transporter (NiCoT) family protein